MTTLAFALLAMPLLFGLLRWVSTASDWRYLAVAVASTVGAIAVMKWRRPAGVTVLRVLVALIIAALLAALTAVALGARSSTSIGVVAIGFALCSGSGAALWERGRRASSGLR
jgi:hypothetical protein